MSTVNYYYPFRFSGIELEAAQWTEEIGRDVVEHRPSRGDGAELSDRGRVPRRYSLSIRVTGTPTQVAEKREALIALAESADTRTFEHPIDGVLRCKLTSLSDRVGSGDVSLEMVLVEDLAFTRRFQVSDRRDLGTFAEVEIRTEEVLAGIANLVIPPLSPIPDFEAMTATASDWRERAQSDVTQDVESMRAETRALQRELDASSALDAYQASVTLEAYRAAYERHARTINSAQGGTFTVDVFRPQPLIVLLSSVYGARRAESVAAEIARINDVADPSRLERGRLLTLPTRVV